MKEVIQRLQTLADRATKYNYPEDSNMGVRISDVLAVLDFYKKTANISEYTKQELNCKAGCMGPCGQCKDEPTNAQDITPEWDKIPEVFNTVVIDCFGIEYAYSKIINTPLANWENEPPNKIKTGRKFNMEGATWVMKISKRPVK